MWIYSISYTNACSPNQQIRVYLVYMTLLLEALDSVWLHSSVWVSRTSWIIRFTKCQNLTADYRWDSIIHTITSVRLRLAHLKSFHCAQICYTRAHCWNKPKRKHTVSVCPFDMKLDRRIHTQRRYTGLFNECVIRVLSGCAREGETHIESRSETLTHAMPHIWQNTNTMVAHGVQQYEALQ